MPFCVRFVGRHCVMNSHQFFVPETVHNWPMLAASLSGTASYFAVIARQAISRKCRTDSTLVQERTGRCATGAAHSSPSRCRAALRLAPTRRHPLAMRAASSWPDVASDRYDGEQSVLSVSKVKSVTIAT
jgi:hypothetical protein